MVETLRQALRSLTLHRLRAALSILGITCGVTSFVAVLSLSEGARRETLAQIEQLGMRNVLVRAAPLSTEQDRLAARVGSAGMTLEDAERLRTALPSLARWAALREVRATVVETHREAAPQVIAVTPSYLHIYRLEPAAGRLLTEDDWRGRRLVCVLGHEVSRRLGAAGQPGATLRVEGSACKVVGVLRKADHRSPRSLPIAMRDLNQVIAVPLGAELAFAHSGALTEIVAEMREPSEVLGSLAVLRRTLQVAHRGADDYRVVAPQELLRQAEAARRNFDVLAITLAILCLAAGGIGIMNTLLAAVTERTAEIGVRRAVGATRRHIARQFLGEAVLLTAAGVACGLVLGLGAVLLASFAAGWPVGVTATTVALPALAALAAGLFFGVHPALQAARLDPIQALRHA